MQEWISPYSWTVSSLGAMGGLFLVQLLVLDVIGIKSGHQPGMPVPSNHDVLLFRATRALGNTNESLAAFVLLALFGLLSHASAGVLGAACWTFVVARAGHMGCYYANLKIPRSVFFAIGFVALLVMAITGAAAWF